MTINNKREIGKIEKISRRTDNKNKKIKEDKKFY